MEIPSSSCPALFIQEGSLALSLSYLNASHVGDVTNQIGVLSLSLLPLD